MHRNHPGIALASDAQRELVAANHILAAHGIVDGFGHVSVRVPGYPNYFLLARSMAPALVLESDIQVYNLQGDTDASVDVSSYLERFIHCEIFRRCPDVGAVVHSHSHFILPFACVPRQSLKPIFHMSGFLGDGVARFDIRDHADTPTDMLIRNPQLGQALANALGDCPIVLMRGHGSTTVARSLRAAVYRAIYAEINAKLQIAAHSLGDIAFLSTEEARCAATTAEPQINRCWELWMRDLAPAVPSGN